jgi:hypothetical protein
MNEEKSMSELKSEFEGLQKEFDAIEKRYLKDKKLNLHDRRKLLNLYQRTDSFYNNTIKIKDTLNGYDASPSTMADRLSSLQNYILRCETGENLSAYSRHQARAFIVAERHK